MRTLVVFARSSRCESNMKCVFALGWLAAWCGRCSSASRCCRRRRLRHHPHRGRRRAPDPDLSCNCITYFHSGRFVPSSPLLYTNDVINEWFEFVKQHDVCLLCSPYGAPPRPNNVMIFWMQLEDLVYIRYTYELCFGRTHIGHILRDNKFYIIIWHQRTTTVIDTKIGSSSSYIILDLFNWCL